MKWECYLTEVYDDKCKESLIVKEIEGQSIIGEEMETPTKEQKR